MAGEDSFIVANRRVDPAAIWLAAVSDAFRQAHAKQCRAKADEFRAARPTPTEHHGSATPEQLSTRWRELTCIATALDAKAQFLESGMGSADVDAALLAEVDSAFGGAL